MTAPLRALDFLSTIGVNVHMEYTDGLYANVAQVKSDLQYLGIKLVRDGVPNSAGGQPFYDQVNALGTLAAAGVKVDLFVNTTDLSAELAQIDAFATSHPGALVAVEGFNEINNFSIGSYDGLTGEAAAKAYQKTLYAAVHADAKLAGVSVYYFTGGSPIDLSANAGLADDENGHPYPNNGEVPGSRFSSFWPQTYLNSNATPKVITETGYFNNPSNPYGSGVNSAVQAIGDVDILLDGALQGVKATYLYQLLAAYPDTGSNTDAEYGLFNYNGSAKPVALAIHDLTTILADTGGTAGSFTPTASTATLSGLPSTALSLALEKSNGTRDLVLWNETPFWNSTTRTQINVRTTTVTVGLGATYQSVSIFDPILGSAAIKTYTDVNSVPVPLAGDPVIVQYSGIVSGGSGGGSSSAAPSILGGAGTLTQTGTGAYTYNGNGSIETAQNGTTHISLAYGNERVDARGTDTITGGSGADTIDATGATLVEFGHGSLLFLNGGHASTVDGGSGSVTMNGGYGGGVLRAGSAGNSILYGGDGNVAMFAEGVGDRLYASAGNDTLTGGPDRCALVGETGAATLIGGSALTVMKAGSGRDLFEAGTTAGAVGQVYNFVVGTDHVQQASLGAGYKTANTAAGTVFTLADGATLTLYGVHGGGASLLS